MNYFLDSSCVIRFLVRDGPVLQNWGNWDGCMSSRLTRLEVARTLNRMHLEGVFDEPELARVTGEFYRLAEGIQWLAMTEEVLNLAAQQTRVHIKSFDAVHLATARILKDTGDHSLIFATHDRRQGAAASALGFAVEGG